MLKISFSSKITYESRVPCHEVFFLFLEVYIKTSTRIYIYIYIHIQSSSMKHSVKAMHKLLYPLMYFLVWKSSLPPWWAQDTIFLVVNFFPPDSRKNWIYSEVVKIVSLYHLHAIESQFEIWFLKNSGGFLGISTIGSISKKVYFDCFFLHWGGRAHPEI